MRLRPGSQVGSGEPKIWIVMEQRVDGQRSVAPMRPVDTLEMIFVVHC
jgi:hypothetical protein